MEKDFIEFDDQEAIKFIQNYLPADANAAISEDDIQYVLDLILDYYDENDLISDDEGTTTDGVIAEELMFESIKKTIAKEKAVTISDESLQLILDGEFQYGKSIGIYFEEEELS